MQCDNCHDDIDQTEVWYHLDILIPDGVRPGVLASAPLNLCSKRCVVQVDKDPPAPDESGPQQ